ncbi:hypothetical protein [Microtetraspora fusca]|uniref:hypothetical protein n=1 Tax=Microtetraspora fusca TaxID=1997 RepID=UPI00082F9F4B|nr:hypothetical protein [Microtetraspora fusca]
MAKNPDSPEITFSEGLELPDGRKVRVLAYSDGSVRFRLDGTPYVISETYLSGGQNDHAIIKLSPGKQGSNAHANWFRDRLEKNRATAE